MYRSFTIKNFRGFQNLSLPSLERVNLIAGMNNVGKTALLEAIFLHLGIDNPELPLRVNVIRGIERIKVDAEGAWGWLFFDKQFNNPIELTSVDHESLTRTLTICLSESEIRQALPPTKGSAASDNVLTSSTTLSQQNELWLDYRDSNKKNSRLKVFLGLEGADVKITWQRQGQPVVSMPRGIYLSTNRPRVAREDIERFSKLEKVDRQNELLAPLRQLEPRLKRLAVLVAGDLPILHGDIGLGELVPLPLMGEGMVRLLSILLAIANAPGGVVLVDEIENGLHHSTLSRIWQALAEAARRYDVQLFATTHSWECVQAAHTAFAESNQYDFKLHRLERISDTIQVASYDQETLATSVEMNLEVR